MKLIRLINKVHQGGESAVRHEKRGIGFAGMIGAVGVVFGAMVLTSGCGRREAAESILRDLHVQVQDAQGLEAGSVVQWRGVEVGRVQSVAMDQGLVRIDVDLHDDYRGTLREGVRARPARGFLGRGAATLDLYGGDDTGRAILRRGASIAEASMADRITPGQIRAIGLLLVAVVVFLVALSIVRKLVVFALALSFLIFAGWFFHRQWQTHGEDFEAARMEMRWSDMARTLLTEEAAQDAWLAVQGDLARALREVGGMGRDKIGEATAELRAQLETRAAEFVEQGKDHAADEIRRLAGEIVQPTPPKVEKQE